MSNQTGADFDRIRDREDNAHLDRKYGSDNVPEPDPDESGEIWGDIPTISQITETVVLPNLDEFRK